MKLRTFILGICLLCLPSTVFAYGEVVDDYPAYEEMYQLVWTNRVRQDPAKAKRDYNNPNAPKNKTWKSKSYAPCNPVMYHHAVSKAARYHSADMQQKGYFSHTGQDGSSPGDRIKRYFTGFGGAGENIAKGQRTPVTVTTAWLNSDGHRENIFRCSWTHLGMGWVASGPHWTQNFITMRGNFERYPVHAGIHSPKQPSVRETTEFYANYLDPKGSAPKEAKVVINGKCYDMKLDYGSENNGTYKTTVTLEKGCAAYYFKFRTSDGELALFPSRGSYQASVEGGSCNGFYVAKQAESNCDAPCASTSECASHQECIDKKCVDTGRCQASTDCSEGYTCKKGKCAPEGQIGNKCEESTDCGSGLSCIETKDGKKCTAQCSASKACPPGYQCITDANQSYCGPNEKCTSDADCSGFYSCVDGACKERNKCTKNTDCGKGTMCADGICKDTGTQGVQCEGSTECDKGSECIPWESGKPSVCGIPCKSQEECPVDTECKGFSDTDKFCFGKPEPPPKPTNNNNNNNDGETGAGCNVSNEPTTPTNAFWFLLVFLSLFAFRRYRAIQ